MRSLPVLSERVKTEKERQRREWDEFREKVKEKRKEVMPL
jgi:hypothetical protein